MVMKYMVVHGKWLIKSMKSIDKPIIIDSKEDINCYIESLIIDLELSEEIKYEMEQKYLNQINYEECQQKNY